MMKMAGCGDLFRLCVLLFCLFNWSEAVVTSLISTVNNLRTTEMQEGCVVHLTCTGNGNVPVWRVFGDRDPIESTSTIQVINPVATVPGPVTGMLIFNPISLRNAGAYTCTIGQVTRTIRLTVTDAVTLLPGNYEYDISDHDVGGTLPVLCRVQTCLSAVTVVVRKGTGVLSEKLTVSGSSLDPQFNLDVTNNLQGEHHCHASFTVDDQAMNTSSMSFNITGTPNIPTTVKPTNKSGAPAVVSPVFSFILFAVTIFLALLH